MQDFYAGAADKTVSLSEIRIQPKNKLSIIVNCQDERLSELFNLNVNTQRIGNGNQRDYGYTVDSEGNINFPVLGEIHVQGLTREEVEKHITKELQSRDLVKEPVVIVDFLNLSVSVLGEVSSPGRYLIDKDDMTLLDAIALAGDLTINAKRENVRVMRRENGKEKVYEVNLCSADQLYSSPVYYLKQNDVIYVEPTAVKARQSTANGNVLLTPSFWMSLASFLASMTFIFIK